VHHGSWDAAEQGDKVIAAIAESRTSFRSSPTVLYFIQGTVWTPLTGHCLCGPNGGRGFPLVRVWILSVWTLVCVDPV
jgi:hypothetical protein